MPAHVLPAHEAPNEGVRLLRIHGRRWKRAVMASKAGVPTATISQWITGRRMPSVDARNMLEETFGIPVSAWEKVRVQP